MMSAKWRENEKERYIPDVLYCGRESIVSSAGLKFTSVMVM
jgi:hypothetical protein